MQADQARTTLDAATVSHATDGYHRDGEGGRSSSDQAAVAKAKLDLSYCEIRAPIAGRTGNLLVHPGNLVKVNDVALVVIHRVAPIFVNFSVPEQHLAAIRRLQRRPQAGGARRIPKDDPGRAATGSLAVIDNTVDTTTGTIHLKATFENRDRLLWPGQFVTAVADARHHAERHGGSQPKPCRPASRASSCTS